ncbi:DUF6624 domain-containing protein [Methylomonas fluvii]|uniref:Uncharacterized protein n=1 Tax=Methylomonas fluvii TaxID=1854564 RepID=A0ABR9DLD9_9GAMM|nr:DUF6624 domain-containing protein [Methylomonas fluvii]MBD9363054.1 hypothetical protein [Methylomonas fluvii]CAD6876279.1 hypothetical protein [Methylomonas fluvii]
MHHSNETLSRELVAMAKNDLSVREALVADGSLGRALYHPRMEAVHIGNAARLAEIIEQYGWPGNSLVGEEGAWGAWLIAQHAIGNPPFMRHCLSLLKQAATNNDVTPWQAAFLEDRIRMYEEKPQIYGTQFQPNQNGELEPYPIENPETVNDRRLAVGLNTIEERTAELTAQSTRENIPTLPDLEEQYQTWLYSVGWRGAS